MGLKWSFQSGVHNEMLMELPFSGPVCLCTKTALHLGRARPAYLSHIWPSHVKTHSQRRTLTQSTENTQSARTCEHPYVHIHMHACACVQTCICIQQTHTNKTQSIMSCVPVCWQTLNVISNITTAFTHTNTQADKHTHIHTII